MTNLSRYIGILSFVLVFICSIRCEDENYFENLPDLDDIVNPHSFSYDKQSKSMIDMTVRSIKSNHYTRENNEEKKDCDCVKHVDKSEVQATVFYKRLINMMLLNMNIKETDGLLIGKLDIKVTPSEIEILKNFDTRRASLREIDEILSIAIKRPTTNRLESITGFASEILERFEMVFRTVWSHPDAVLIACVLLAIVFTLRMIRHGHGKGMFVLILFIFVLSFVMTWWNLLKEAEIKNMAEQMKYSELPISCQPEKMTRWDKLKSYIIANDDCEKYYIAMYSNPKLKVTPAHVLTHLCTSVMLPPIIHMGTAVSGFINNATDTLPWLYCWTIRCLLYGAVCVVLIMLPLSLCGLSIDLGFGPLFKFAIGFHKKRGPGNSLESEIKREPVQIYLQVQGTNPAPLATAPAVTNAPNIKDVSAIADVPAITNAPAIVNEPAIVKEPAEEQLIQFEDSGDVCQKTDDVKNVRDSSCFKKHDGGGDTFFDCK